MLRADLKRFCKLMKLTVKWNFSDFHTCLFEENPNAKLEAKELRSFGKKDDFFGNGGRCHGHILFEYNGNQGRGCKAKVIKRFSEWLAEKGWQLYFSSVLDEAQPRPFYHFRERQECYLMINQYRFFIGF